MRVPPAWVRRPVLIAAVLAVTVVVLAAAPLLLLVAVITSPLIFGRRRPVRLLGFLIVYLVAESAGLIAAFVLWVVSGFGWRLRTPRFVAAHYALMRRLLGILYRAAVRLFRLQVSVEAPVQVIPAARSPSPGRRPLLVLCRHAGPGDSFLLVHALLADYDRRVRIVLKDTMALDPLVDVLLSRLPSSFIEPNPRAGEQIEAAISTLAATAGPDDALVLFPEGGNFSQRRRLRAIELLRSRGLRRQAARAERLRHVLPPRPGGASAAMARLPQADVVFVAHTGLEDMDSVLDVWRGLPMDSAIRVRWWRVPAECLPAGDSDRANWLLAWWEMIDMWIAETRAADAPSDVRNTGRNVPEGSAP